MRAALEKPTVYKDIDYLTVKMKKEEEKIRNLFEDAFKITRLIHMNEAGKTAR